MRSAQKLLSAVTLFSLLLSTTYPGTTLLAAPVPHSINQEALTLPNAKVGAEYEYQFQSEGGLAPLTWRVAQGDLPPGVKLELSGRLHGAPTQAQREAYGFVVEVSDSSRTPQKVLQPFLLSVNAAPLRVVMSVPKLKILPPSGSDAQSASPAGPRASEDHSSTPDNSSAAPKPQPIVSPSLALKPTVESPMRGKPSRLDNQPAPAKPASKDLPAINGLNDECTLVAAKKSKDANDKRDDKRKGVDPYTFIRIYEGDTEGGKRTLIYDPEYAKKRDLSSLSADQQSRSITKLSADKNSKLVIVPVTSLMDEDLPLNNLYMSANLASGDTSTNLEIDGYAKIGKSIASGQTQRGTSFQSVRDIQARLLTLAFAADNILDTYYGEDQDKDEECLPKAEQEKARESRKQKEKNETALLTAAMANDPTKLAANEKKRIQQAEKPVSAL